MKNSLRKYQKSLQYTHGKTIDIKKQLWKQKLGKE